MAEEPWELENFEKYLKAVKGENAMKEKRIQKPQEKGIEKRGEPGWLAMAPDASISPGLTGADLTPPTYRLVQKTSRVAETEPDTVGCFVGGAEPKQRIRCVVLRVQLTRVLWPSEIGMGPPECSSNDRIRPNPGGAYSGPCDSCPRRRDRPELEEDPRGWCSPGATILLYDLEDEAPYILRVAGKSGYAPFKEWLFRAGMSPHRGRTWEFPTEISAYAYKGPKGTYYRMRFSKGRPFTPEEAEKHAELVKQLRDVLLTAPMEAEEELEPEPQPEPESPYEQGRREPFWRRKEGASPLGPDDELPF